MVSRAVFQIGKVLWISQSIFLAWGTNRQKLLGREAVLVALGDLLVEAQQLYGVKVTKDFQQAF